MPSSVARYLQIASIASAFGALDIASAAAGTIDTLRQDKTIRLAVRDDAPPFSFRDAAGEPAGFIVDLCRAVARDLAAQLRLPELKVVYVPVTAANRFEAIETGKADLLDCQIAFNKLQLFRERHFLRGFASESCPQDRIQMS